MDLASAFSPLRSLLPHICHFYFHRVTLPLGLGSCRKPSPMPRSSVVRLWESSFLFLCVRITPEDQKTRDDQMKRMKRQIHWRVETDGGDEEKCRRRPLGQTKRSRERSGYYNRAHRYYNRAHGPGSGIGLTDRASGSDRILKCGP